jgi:hypothetical protein
MYTVSEMTLFEQNQHINWLRSANRSMTKSYCRGRCRVGVRYLPPPWLCAAFYAGKMLPCRVKRSEKWSKLHSIFVCLFIFPGSAAQRVLWPPRSRGFVITRHATVGRTPPDEWSARRRDLYLTTHTTEKHPCPWWDSNPWSQQASGRRPRP